jgi:conjugative transfer region protein (TIGR03748 family)
VQTLQTVLLFTISAALAGCATAPQDAPTAGLALTAADTASIPYAGDIQGSVPAVPSNVRMARNETQVGRYTTVTTQPAEDEVNPLAVIAKVHFPRSVVTSVGEAVRYVLVRTGYQLGSEETLDPRVKAVFALRLPDNQRALGPYRVDAMLNVLMGRPYSLVADSSTRTVKYVVNDATTASAAAN